MKSQGFTDAVVLGMGGSSLGPEVLAKTFRKRPGFPKLHVLDSTDPAQVGGDGARCRSREDALHCLQQIRRHHRTECVEGLFLRSRGGHGRPNNAGSHFIAVTDPGSSLEKVARTQSFARVFHGDPTIGGRYSVLSPFGLVPAAAAGIDIANCSDLTLTMVRSCGPDVPPQENPGVQLGLLLGLAGRDGRDKVTILSSKTIADFGAWAEQLIAESTGKDGKGLIPIDGEPLGVPAIYGNDRLFIDLRTEADGGHIS